MDTTTQTGQANDNGAAKSNNANWRNDPITPEQVEQIQQMLEERDLEMTEPFPTTKGGGSSVISRLIAQPSRSPATPQQIERLVELKNALFKDDDLHEIIVSKSRAAQVITGWTRSLERRQATGQHQADVWVSKAKPREAVDEETLQAAREAAAQVLAAAEARAPQADRVAS